MSSTLRSAVDPTPGDFFVPRPGAGLREAVVSMRPPHGISVEIYDHNALSIAGGAEMAADELELTGLGHVMLADVDALWRYEIAEVGWLIRGAVAGLVPGGELRAGALCAGSAPDWVAAARSVLEGTEWCPRSFEGPDLGQLAQVVGYGGAVVAEAHARWHQVTFPGRAELVDWVFGELGWRWLAKVPEDRREQVFAKIAVAHAKRTRYQGPVVDLVEGTVTAQRPEP